MTLYQGGYCRLKTILHPLHCLLLGSQGFRVGSTLVMWKPDVMLTFLSSRSLVTVASKERGEEEKKKEKKQESSWFLSTLPYIVVGAGVGAVAAPAALAAAGFTGAGITAGSVGAAMMKSTAIASGGGVAAGSVVAILQSLGATTGAAYVTAAVGGVAGYVYRKFTGKSDKEEKK